MYTIYKKINYGIYPLQNLQNWAIPVKCLDIPVYSLLHAIMLQNYSNLSK